MHPNRGAMAKLLRERLPSEMDGDHIREEIDEILAMQLAAEKPDLYEKARKNKLTPFEAKRLRQWSLPRRRRLLLEVGESLAKNLAELREQDPDHDPDEGPDLDELNSKAEVLVDLSTPHCPKEYRGVLTRGELKRFMLQAGLDSQFVADQLARIPPTWTSARNH